MALQSWKCKVCGKDFTVGEWACMDGLTNHVVEEKEYLLADAPSDPGHVAPGSNINTILREGQTVICNIPPPQKVMEGDTVKWVGEGNVLFRRGEFHTSDPQQQYWLDRKGGFCTRDQWNRVWLTESQQLNLERQNLDAMKQRLESDRNELLSQVKQQKAAR